MGGLIRSGRVCVLIAAAFVTFTFALQSNKAYSADLDDTVFLTDEDKEKILQNILKRIGMPRRLAISYYRDGPIDLSNKPGYQRFWTAWEYAENDYMAGRGTGYPFAAQGGDDSDDEGKVD